MTLTGDQYIVPFTHAGAPNTPAHGEDASNSEKGKFTKRNIALTIALFAYFILSLNVEAGVGGDAWLPIWTELQGWVNGYPGKIVALLAFFVGVAQFMRQNWYAAIGAIVGCLLMANAEGIISGFLTAGIPL